MAKKVTVALVDDFDGAGAADETVEFGLDGVTYEIDLSSKNAKKLRDDLKVWGERGRGVGGGGGGRAPGRGPRGRGVAPPQRPQRVDQRSNPGRRDRRVPRRHVVAECDLTLFP